MPTPRKGYYTTKGERVPGVTTILSRFKDAGGLIHWANQLAYVPYREARAMIDRIVKQGAVDPGTLHDCKLLLAKPEDACDYRVARDSAASVGTIVHARIDAHVRGLAFDAEPYRSDEFPDPIEASRLGFEAFLEWAGSTSFGLAEGEVQLVSDELKFGGTPDVIVVRGERSLGDWKSGDLYPSQLLPQLAAYEHLLAEAFKIEGGHGGHAISVNKKTGGFTHRYFTPEEMTRGWEAFKLMRELYELVKELK